MTHSPRFWPLICCSATLTMFLLLQGSMFESNFPVDKGTCSYQVLWNAFKRIAPGYSADEKTALFSGAAKEAYRLDV